MTDDPIEAAVFDLDDTLYREHDYVLSGFDVAGEHLRARHGIDGFAHSAREIFASGARGDVFDRALAALGRPSPALVQELLSVYRAHAPTLRLYPDAHDALKGLRGRLKLGIITDGWLAVQRAKVAALGLSSRVNAVVYSDLYGRARWKPDPLPYETAANALRVEPTRCLYVGDNPAKDFITARALGWRTWQIVRPGGEYTPSPPTPSHAPDRVIADLREVLSLVSP